MHYKQLGMSQGCRSRTSMLGFKDCYQLNEWKLMVPAMLPS